MDRLSKHREEYSTVTQAVPTLCCFWIIVSCCTDSVVRMSLSLLGKSVVLFFYVQLVLLHIKDMEKCAFIFFRNQKIASLKECRF